jgi:hypothetical protein
MRGDAVEVGMVDAAPIGIEPARARPESGVDAFDLAAVPVFARRSTGAGLAGVARLSR